MYQNQKNIKDLLVVVSGNIVDARQIQNIHIDTIVNAANPTLMGSNQGDGAIHAAVNRLLTETGETLADRIYDELHTGYEKNLFRCEHGKSIVASGHELCKRIIYVVEIPYDSG